MLISLCYINALLHIYQKSNDTLDLHTWLYLLASASASCLYLVHSRSDFRRVSSSRFACSTCVCSRPFSYAILFFCSIISFNVVSTCFCACCYKYVSNLCDKIFQNVSFSLNNLLFFSSSVFQVRFTFLHSKFSSIIKIKNCEIRMTLFVQFIDIDTN